MTKVQKGPLGWSDNHLVVKDCDLTSRSSANQGEIREESKDYHVVPVQVQPLFHCSRVRYQLRTCGHTVHAKHYLTCS